ncbi:MAG: leucyl/phenylalanyl-tRNA--protein transferase [Chitinophagaceae bacterium]
MILLSRKLNFPPPESAGDDGLLCMGGDLSVERLLLAYRNGIFPWYEGDIPIWWNPDPRFVLFPGDLKVSKSMKQVLKRKDFTITCNTHFLDVIRNCQQAKREDQNGTWINEDVIDAYNRLHELGYAISYEAWQDSELVGGFYGLRIGQVFFGESMFSKLSNASKAAFITGVQDLIRKDIQLIDCQVYTPHLESLGAGMIARKDFLALLKQLIKNEADANS